MRKIIEVLLIMISVLANAQENKDFLNEPQDEFKDRMEWFGKAKYGMFIHFGLSAQLGGIWKGKVVDHYSEWIQANADITPQEYAMLAHAFNPKDFDANFIVETAKKAGMKYLVITTKHHEGFCLWNSKYTNFDVGSTPFKRDILAELSTACRKYGIKFGVYYSIIDWHHPSQERNIDGHNPWTRWGLIRMKTGRKSEYVTYVKNQVKELIENYTPDLLWFDGGWTEWWGAETGSEVYNYIRNIKPSIIINDRLQNTHKKDYGTPEQSHPEDKPDDRYWEACYTMNESWGFKKGDDNWKTPEDIYEKLKDINKKGGNLLLNIGPDGDGKVPEESIQILLKVGEKLK